MEKVVLLISDSKGMHRPARDGDLLTGEAGELIRYDPVSKTLRVSKAA